MTTPPRPRPGRFTAAALLLAVLCGALAGLAAAAPAYAHATVVTTTPRANATVDTAPTEVVVTFSEPVTPVRAETWVVGPDGSRANDGDATAAGDTLVYPLLDDLPDGTYLVGYRVISADGHPVPGGFSFSIGAPSASPPAAPTGAGPDVDPVVDITVKILRGLSIAGIMLAVGPGLLLLTRWPAPRRGILKLTATGMSVLAFSAVAGLYLQAPYSVGTTMFDVTARDIAAVADSRFGSAMLLRLLAVLAALPVLVLALRHRARAGDKWLLAAAGLAAVVSWPLSGHATTSPAPPLTVVTDTVHVAAAAVWIGGLAALLGYLLRPALADRAAAFLPVWSVWATRAVIALALAGTVQALIEIAEPAALWETTYGRLVIAKVVLLALILAAAAGARGIVRAHPRAAGDAGADAAAGDGPDGEAEDAGAGPGPVPLTGAEMTRLRRSILVELVLAVAVIAVTAVLVQATPARIDYAQQRQETAGDFSARLSNEYFQLQVEVEPGTVGNNSLHLYAFKPDGTDLDVLEWSATFARPEANVPPVSIELLELSPNHVTGEITVPSAGDWLFSFTLRVSRFDQGTVTQTVPIR